MEKVKTQVVFPEELLKRLDRVVKRRERSEFVVRAVEDKLRKQDLQEALRGVAGIWKDRDDLKTDADVKRYLKRVGGGSEVREKRLRKARRDG